MNMNRLSLKNIDEENRKTSSQKWWIYYKGKSTLKHFGIRKPSSGLKHCEASVARTMMDILIKYNNRETEKYIYTKKDHITVQSFNQCSFLKQRKGI